MAIKGSGAQKVYYDNYWRAEVKECCACRLTRPLTYFSRDNTGRFSSGYQPKCKACVNVYARKRRRLNPRVSQVEQAWVRANKDRVSAQQKRYRARPEARLSAKLRRIALEQKRGESIYKTRSRTIRGCFTALAQSLREYWGIPCTTQEAADRFKNHVAFITAYRAWKVSGFKPGLRPVPAAKNDDPQSALDFTVQTRSEQHKRRYEKDSKRSCGIADINQQRKRTEQVCVEDTNTELESRRVPVEADSGTLQRTGRSRITTWEYQPGPDQDNDGEVGASPSVP